MTYLTKKIILMR